LYCWIKGGGNTAVCGDLQECKYPWLRIFGYKRNDLENISTPIPHFTGITHSAKTVHNTKIQKAISAEQQEQVHQMIYKPLVHKREKIVLELKMDKNYQCKVNVCEVRDRHVKGTFLFTL
jgi:sucrose-6-phosphate hydrolase SacC (GH32 family)